MEFHEKGCATCKNTPQWSTAQPTPLQGEIQKTILTHQTIFLRFDLLPRPPACRSRLAAASPTGPHCTHAGPIESTPHLTPTSNWVLSGASYPILRTNQPAMARYFNSHAQWMACRILWPPFRNFFLAASSLLRAPPLPYSAPSIYRQLPVICLIILHCAAYQFASEVSSKFTIYWEISIISLVY